MPIDNMPSRKPLSAAINLALTATLGIGMLLAPAVQAADFPVTNNNDAGAGSLRQAILDANLNVGADTISFSSVTGTIVLTTGDLNITDDLEINGPGADVLAIDGNDSSRIFDIDETTATINDLTVQNGSAFDGAGIRNLSSDFTLNDSVVTGNDAVIGGGILAYDSRVNLYGSVVSNNYAERGAGIQSIISQVIIVDSTISGNTAAGPGTNVGGGLYAESSFVLLYDSTVSNNYAEFVGGIGGSVISDEDANNYNVIVLQRSTVSNNTAALSAGGVAAVNFFDAEDGPGSIVFVTNSTVSGNRVLAPDGDGGGVYVGVYSEAFLLNATLSDNSAASGGGIQVGPEDGPPASAFIINTIIGNNTGGDCVLGSSGFLENDGFNVIEDTGDNACGMVNGVNDNIIGVDPLLSPLADNSDNVVISGISSEVSVGKAAGSVTSAMVGNTPPLTHALLKGSPAIDAADFELCNETGLFVGVNGIDQGGIPRGVNGVGAINFPQFGDCDIGAVEYNIQVPAEAVPTLSIWGLGILSGILGFMGFRRRAK